MFSIIGNGQWGTAIASYLGKNFPVELIGRRIKKLPENGQTIPQKIYSDGIAYDHLIYAAPTKHALDVLDTILDGDKKPFSLIIASKGLVMDSAGKVICLSDFVQRHIKRVALISGPSFASELMDNKPTHLVGAAKDDGLINDLREWFQSDPINLVISKDITGVSFSGAFKNPIAILIGYIDHLFMSVNLRFGLITYVNQVLFRLLEVFNMDPQTAYGFAGQGDLFMTCSIDQSRNRHMGQLLAQGYKVSDAEKVIGSTVEGVTSLKYLTLFCKQNKVNVPLFAFISDVIEGRLKKTEVLNQLTQIMHAPSIRSQEILDV